MSKTMIVIILAAATLPLYAEGRHGEAQPHGPATAGFPNGVPYRTGTTSRPSAGSVGARLDPGRLHESPYFQRQSNAWSKGLLESATRRSPVRNDRQTARDWFNVPNVQGRHLWVTPEGWRYSGKHGSVIIDIGSGGCWWGAPDGGWRRLERRGSSYCYRRPVDGRLLVVYDTALPYAVWDDWAYADSLPYFNAPLPPAEGTVRPADAWKLFIPPRPGQEGVQGAVAAGGEGPEVLQPDAPGAGRATSVAAGQRLFLMKRYDDAAAYFSLASQLDPNDMTARRLLTLALVAIGEYDAAGRQLDAALKGGKLSPEAGAALCAPAVDLYADQGELARQMGLLDLAAGRAKDAPRLRLLSAWFKAVAGLKDDALRTLSAMGGDPSAKALADSLRP